MNTIAPRELVVVEVAAQRIVDVRIGAGLVEHEVASGERPHDAGQRLEEAGRVARVVATGGDVSYGVAGAGARDDVLGAVAVVLVAIEDPDPPRRAFRAQGEHRHHQPVERAEACRSVPVRVVEAGTRRAGDRAGRECMARGGQHRAARPRQRCGHGGAAVAETVVLAQREDRLDVLRIVGAREFVRRHRTRPALDDGPVALVPARDDVAGLAGRRGAELRFGDLLRREVHGDRQAGGRGRGLVPEGVGHARTIRCARLRA